MITEQDILKIADKFLNNIKILVTILIIIMFIFVCTLMGIIFYFIQTSYEDTSPRIHNEVIGGDKNAETTQPAKTAKEK